MPTRSEERSLLDGLSEADLDRLADALARVIRSWWERRECAPSVAGDPRTISDRSGSARGANA
jgi:hypothetical protein